MFSKPKKITPADIENAVPLRGFPPRIIRYVAKLSKLKQVSKGHKLYEIGDNSKYIYLLLKGELQLRAPNKEPRAIKAGSPEANFPLGRAHPSPHEAVTTSGATLAVMSRELLKNIERININGPLPAKKFMEVVEDELEDKLYVDFFTKLQDGKFELPSMPDIAVRIGKAVADPNTNSADIAKMLQFDPALTARIISVVNSSLYAGQKRINSCPDAVTRLGRQVTRNLVLSFVLKSLFRTRNESLRKRMSELWAHSREVGALCHVLARKVPGLDPDRAMLAGLIHDIGVVPIINGAKDYPQLAENPELLEKTIHRLRAQVGNLVLKKWDFLSEFNDVALHSEDWMRDTSDTPDYTDLVIVSQLHTYIGKPRMAQLPRLDLVPSFHKLSLGKLSPRYSLKILDEAKADIRAVESILQG